MFSGLRSQCITCASYNKLSASSNCQKDARKIRYTWLRSWRKCMWDTRDRSSNPSVQLSSLNNVGKVCKQIDERVNHRKVPWYMKTYKSQGQSMNLIKRASISTGIWKKKSTWPVKIRTSCKEIPFQPFVFKSSNLETQDTDLEMSWSNDLQSVRYSDTI